MEGARNLDIDHPVNKDRNYARVSEISLIKSLEYALSKEVDLDLDYYENIIKQSTASFKDLKQLQTRIQFLICDLNRELHSQSDMDEELSWQLDHDSSTNDRINILIGRVMGIAKTFRVPINASSNVVNRPIAAAQLKLPQLVIDNFEDNSKDSFSFFKFKSSFLNAMNSVEGTSNAVKMVYLKSYLKGRALALIDTLPVSDDNFEIAWNLLEAEFLDRNFLVNSTLCQIVDWKTCKTIDANLEFINFIRIKLNELSRFHVNFFAEDSSGETLMSNIVRNKLHHLFLTELCRKINTNYPTVNNILEHSVAIHKLIETTPSEINNNNFSQRSFYSAAKSNSAKNDYSKNPFLPLTSSDPKGCKFCSLLNHSSVNCRKYPNFESRKNRASQLGLCTKCLSGKHSHISCSGNFGKLPFSCASCRVPEHVTPMCPSMVLSLSAAKLVENVDLNTK